MDSRLTISLLNVALNDIHTVEGAALLRAIDSCEWGCSTQPNMRRIITVYDDDGDERFQHFGGDAHRLYDTMPTRMRRMFEEELSNRKQVLVGKARIIPFPDSQRPTHAA